ncbi:MAG: GNAT family N-acetyltransferase [Actinomycetia bacterium]|nr:GNAT family N-acetyltransferase [Actinomycetes bacterium]
MPTFPRPELSDGTLVLRALRPDDVPGIVRACRDQQTQRWLPLKRDYDDADARDYIELAGPVQSSGDGMLFAIEVAGDFAGAIDLKKTDWVVKSTEIGYWVVPEHRGHGLAGRAASLLADWVLTQMRFERVVIQVAAGNEASLRAARQAGFRFEGVARRAGTTHSGVVDLHVFSKISDDLP